MCLSNCNAAQQMPPLLLNIKAAPIWFILWSRYVSNHPWSTIISTAKIFTSKRVHHLTWSSGGSLEARYCADWWKIRWLWDLLPAQSTHKRENINTRTQRHTLLAIKIIHDRIIKGTWTSECLSTRDFSLCLLSHYSNPLFAVSASRGGITVFLLSDTCRYPRPERNVSYFELQLKLPGYFDIQHCSNSSISYFFSHSWSWRDAPSLWTVIRYFKILQHVVRQI